MTSINLGAFKEKLQKLSFTPSKDKQSKTPKKKGYKERMKQRYNITDDQFDDEKLDANQQLKNWNEYRKDQVVEIFKSTSEYVSKSKKSDVLHPKIARAKTVMNSKGQKIEVEFGRLREYYLFTIQPNKEFIVGRDQEAHDKALGDLREKQRINFEQRKDKQNTKLKMQAEYEQSKSIYETAAPRPQPKIIQQEQKEPIEEATAPVEHFIPNTTDIKHFNDNWYKQPISRSQLCPGKMIYWQGNEEDEDQFDDDPDGKYTVTAEKMIETLTAGGKVKDSGVVEPTNLNAKNIMTEQLASINTKYKKSCGREIVFLNTLKGTIDFMKKQSAPEKANTTNPISQDEPTDAINQITFDSTITAHVFKGKRLKRQYGIKKDLETFEENRKDYTREAGEETSGI